MHQMHQPESAHKLFQFLTFPHTPDQKGLSSITLMPRNAPDTAGRWRVWLWIEGQPDVQGKLLWDRKIEEVRTSDCL